jgi:hypothetical protein
MAITDIATFPTEIYENICSLATATPEAFDLSVRSVGREDTCWWEEDRGLIDIKTTLSLVSKQFRAITLKYLFEVLILDIDKLLERLSRASSVTSASPDPSVWNHVLYIELRGGRARQDRANLEDRRRAQLVYESVLMLSHRCPNVVVCKDRTKYTCPPKFFDGFFQHRHSSLRRLEISDAEARTTFPQLLANALPNLQYISLENMGAFWASTAWASRTITLPSLHTLYIKGDFGWGDVAWNVANLQFFGQIRPEDGICNATFEPRPNHIRRLDLRGTRLVELGLLMSHLFPGVEYLAVTSVMFTITVSMQGYNFPLHEVVVEHYKLKDEAEDRYMEAMAAVLVDRNVCPSLRRIFVQREGALKLDVDPENWSQLVQQFRGHDIALEGRGM